MCCSAAGSLSALVVRPEPWREACSGDSTGGNSTSLYYFNTEVCHSSHSIIMSNPNSNLLYRYRNYMYVIFTQTVEDLPKNGPSGCMRDYVDASPHNKVSRLKELLVSPFFFSCDKASQTHCLDKNHLLNETVQLYCLIDVFFCCFLYRPVSLTEKTESEKDHQKP